MVNPQDSGIFTNRAKVTCLENSFPVIRLRTLARQPQLSLGAIKRTFHIAAGMMMTITGEPLNASQGWLEV